MGKRSNYEKKELAFYPTPMKPVIPLLSHLWPRTKFCEPCAGEGHLIRHLESHGHKCVSAFDVQPRHESIYQQDASFMSNDDMRDAELIITNPPWERDVLHQIIERCLTLRPSWLLFDADWMHTKQAKPYLEHCSTIVSVGRVRWIEDSKSDGVDNSCWYFFNATNGPPTFYGRGA